MNNFLIRSLKSAKDRSERRFPLLNGLLLIRICLISLGRVISARARREWTAEVAFHNNMGRVYIKTSFLVIHMRLFAKKFVHFIPAQWNSVKKIMLQCILIPIAKGCIYEFTNSKANERSFVLSGSVAILCWRTIIGRRVDWRLVARICS